MRSLTLGLMALSLVSVDAFAQRPGRVRQPVLVRQPDVPAEKPPQAPGITDARLYSQYRLGRLSLEQYPMLSRMTTVGYLPSGAESNNWTLGDGMQVGFNAAPSLSFTLDLTSALFGGPFAMGTTDVGVRVKPWTSPRFTPFADARLSYAYTTGLGGSLNGIPLYFLYRSMTPEFSLSSGNGRILGLGVDTRIGTRWKLTTALSSTHFNMERRDFSTMTQRDFTTTTTRLTIGLRYLQGRWFDPPR